MLKSSHRKNSILPEERIGADRAAIFATQTANTLVCIEASQRRVVILSSDVRSEAGYPELVRFILGDTGVPYDWEYGDHAGKS